MEKIIDSLLNDQLIMDGIKEMKMKNKNIPEEKEKQIKQTMENIFDCLEKDDFQHDIVVSSLTNVLLFIINISNRPEEISRDIAKVILNYKEYKNN